ncbi:hypothetical protein BDY19DRAFT_722699 [Irpex rosettiformis]|uniref:Uncharacterized protein n=1 Tax=Irpex rosettiformis TaxID=378272 RepID=A0ACB8U8Q8_9APHY|nr:hypothetical protein BDY19DRAFT_722699 [Irpex rosettiformis]
MYYHTTFLDVFNIANVPNLIPSTYLPHGLSPPFFLLLLMSSASAFFDHVSHVVVVISPCVYPTVLPFVNYGMTCFREARNDDHDKVYSYYSPPFVHVELLEYNPPNIECTNSLSTDTT